MGKLKVTILSARDLEGKDIGGTSDPFVQVTIGQIKHKTEHMTKTCNPTWNTTLFFDLPVTMNAGTESATFEVFDYDRFGSSDLIGKTSIALGTLYKGQSLKVDLRLSNSRNGVLSVELLAEDFGQAVPQSTTTTTTAQPPQQQQYQQYPPQQYPPQQYGYPQQYPPQQFGQPQYPPQQYGQQYPPQQYPPQYGYPQQQQYPPQQ